MDDEPHGNDFAFATVRRLARAMAAHADKAHSTSADRRTAMIAQMLVAHQDQIDALRQRVHALEAANDRLVARLSRLERKQA